MAQSEVQKWPREDDSVANLTLGGEVGEVLLLRLLGLVEWERAGLGVERVAAELGGDEALHAGGHRRVQQRALVVQHGVVQRRDDGVLALQRLDERAGGRVVDGLDINLPVEGVCGGLAVAAGEDGQLELA